MGLLDRFFGRSKTLAPLITASISIPASGPPRAIWTPDSASARDLGLMSVCYTAKMGWLTAVETAVQPVFETLAGDLASLDDQALLGNNLLSVLPSARQIQQGLDEGERAVAGGEEFRLEFLRAIRTSLGGSDLHLAWVKTWLPEPGLAPNIPWSAFVLLSVVWPRLTAALRIAVRDTIGDILRMLRHDGSIPPGDQRHLELLFTIVSGKWQTVAA